MKVSPTPPKERLEEVQNMRTLQFILITKSLPFGEVRRGL